MGMLDDEISQWKRSFGLLGGIPKTLKNNPANRETLDSLLGVTGMVPGLGDVQSGLLAANDLKHGDYLSAGLNGAGVLPMVPALAGMVRPKYWDGLVDALRSGRAVDVPFGKITPRNEARVNALREVLGQPLVQRGEDWVIPENVVRKLMDKRIGQDGMTPEKLADSLNSAVHSTRNRVFQSQYPQNQGMLTPKGEKSNLAYVSVNPKTGDPVIKSGYRMDTARGNKAMNEGEGLLSAGGTQSAIVTTPEGVATGAYLPGYAESPPNIARPLTQYEQAHDIARKNAVGLLGLPKNNTAMDRANAMPEFSKRLWQGMNNVDRPGNWYGNRPETSYQNRPVTMEFRGPSTGLLAEDKPTAYGARFTRDVASFLGDDLGADLLRNSGGEAVPHGEMIQFLRSRLGVGGLGDEAALNVYNTLAGTKGFSGNDWTLLHPTIPVRYSTAAFDPFRRSELDPLASLLAVPTGGLLLDTDTPAQASAERTRYVRRNP